MTLPRGTDLGTLSIEEVYVNYDGPRLFVARNESGQRYIALFVDEDSVSETYVYAPVSVERFIALRSGELPLRISFIDPPDGHVYAVRRTFDTEETELQRLSGTSIPGDWLPEPDVRIVLSTPTAPPFDIAELIDQAHGTHRTVFAISLDNDSTRTEYPIRPLGELLTVLQSNLNAFAQEVVGAPTSVSKIPHDLLVSAEASLVGVRSGSLVVLVTSSPEAQLFEADIFRPALDRIVQLINATHDEDELQEDLGQLHSRARSHFRALLETLDDAGTGAEFYVATADRDLVEARLSRDDVRAGLAVVRRVAPEPEEELIIEGELVGANERTLVFELFDHENNQKYSGKAIERAAAQLEGLQIGERYRATILREVEVAELTGDTKLKYRLKQIEKIV